LAQKTQFQLASLNASIMPAAAHSAFVQSIVSSIMPHGAEQRQQATVPPAASLSAPKMSTHSQTQTAVASADYDKAYAPYDLNGAAPVSFWHMVDLSQF
jgi:protein-disulfide isomerase